MTRSDKIQLIVIWGLALVLGLALYIGYAAYTRTPAKAHAATFDRSMCQYPDRSTNPAGSCDNSDPCDVEDAVKGGSGSCKDQGDLPDPDRGSYDADGNYYDYQGNLVTPAPVENVYTENVTYWGGK